MSIAKDLLAMYEEVNEVSLRDLTDIYNDHHNVDGSLNAEGEKRNRVKKGEYTARDPKTGEVTGKEKYARDRSKHSLFTKAGIARDKLRDGVEKNMGRDLGVPIDKKDKKELLIRAAGKIPYVPAGASQRRIDYKKKQASAALRQEIENEKNARGHQADIRRTHGIEVPMDQCRQAARGDDAERQDYERAKTDPHYAQHLKDVEKRRDSDAEQCLRSRNKSYDNDGSASWTDLHKSFSGSGSD